MLRLLALVVGGLGGEGLRDFTAPSERLAEALSRAEVADGAAREDRRAQVLEFIAAAGGEVG